MVFSVLAEIKWSFKGEDIDWLYLRAHAAFVHQEACEFILHIGSELDKSDYVEEITFEMKEFGCSSEFIQTYLDAVASGAVRVIFSE